MKTTILSVVLFVSATFARPQPGLPFLLIWPTARSTALAGAMTGLADDPDAAFFNPAGLAFHDGVSATVNHADWLPGFYPDMHFAYGALRFRSAESNGTCHRWGFGLDASYLNLSDSYDKNYEPPMPYPDVWRGSIGITGSFAVASQLAVGAKFKLIHSDLATSLGWRSMPELGIETDSTGSTWAADLGALWRPSAKFSLGGSAANLGPGISYPSTGEHAPSPATLRLGACWTPVNNRYLRVNVLPEFDKLLVGMFSDTADTRTFGQELQAELSDVWKTLAVEVTGLGLIAVRFGYFEDRTWQRGGLVCEKDGMTYHYTLYDLLTRRGLGKLKSVGLCWGFGIGFRDYFRLDVSSDAAIYDFPTENWKLSLVANDIAGGIRELKQGSAPWEE